MVVERGRWGRRRPYLAIGVMLSFAAVYFMALATDLPGYTIAFAVTQVRSAVPARQGRPYAARSSLFHWRGARAAVFDYSGGSVQRSCSRRCVTGAAWRGEVGGREG